jgi:hypothetical protein
MMPAAWKVSTTGSPVARSSACRASTVRGSPLRAPARITGKRASRSSAAARSTDAEAALPVTAGTIASRKPIAVVAVDTS